MSVTSCCRSIDLSVNFFLVDEVLSVGHLSVGEWSCYRLKP